MEALTIRQYKTTDKQRLIEILKLNVPKFFVESEVRDLCNYLDNNVEEYFVTEFNGEILGAGGINFENDYKTATISWDFIHPDFHGKGIGKKLLAHRLDFLKSFATIQVVLVRTSQHAYKFYEKSGFVVKEVHKDYWAQNFDMYKMVLE